MIVILNQVIYLITFEIKIKCPLQSKHFISYIYLVFLQYRIFQILIVHSGLRNWDIRCRNRGCNMDLRTILFLLVLLPLSKQKVVIWTGIAVFLDSHIIKTPTCLTTIQNDTVGNITLFILTPIYTV